MTMVPTAEFDWEDTEAVVLPEQPRTAVFVNTHGAVVVRQRCADDEDSDVYVLIQPHNARLVALAIMACAKQSAACFEDEPCPIPGPTSSAAERQRRYRSRKKQRNGRDAENVTGDGHGVTQSERVAGDLWSHAAE